MTLDKILGEVNAIFVDVLDESNLKVGEGTTANDIEGWDSLTHIEIVVGIEKHFRIRFTTAEIQAFKNVGEMCLTIQGKMAKIGN